MQLTHTGFEVRDAIALPQPGATVRAEAERRDAYSVRVTTDIRSAFDAVAELVAGRSVAILTDETVEALYGPALVRHLRACDADPLLHAVPPGEGSKSLERACGLWDWLAGSQLARRDVLVNFGGGVIADLGGWVASAYMRGLPYLNLPTSSAAGSTPPASTRACPSSPPVSSRRCCGSGRRTCPAPARASRATRPR